MIPHNHNPGDDHPWYARAVFILIGAFLFPLMMLLTFIRYLKTGYNNGRNQPPKKVTPDQHKLHTALIEIGKEANNITPTQSAINHCHTKLQEAITKGDMIGQRKYGRLLAAMVVKWMVERV